MGKRPELSISLTTGQGEWGREEKGQPGKRTAPNIKPHYRKVTSLDKPLIFELAYFNLPPNPIWTLFLLQPKNVINAILGDVPFSHSSISEREGSQPS